MVLPIMLHGGPADGIGIPAPACHPCGECAGMLYLKHPVSGEVFLYQTRKDDIYNADFLGPKDGYQNN